MSAEAAYVQHVVQCLEADPSGAAPSALNTHLHELLRRLRTDDQAAFESLVTELVRPLELYARRFSHSSDSAQDIVQDVFAHLWEQRHAVHVRGSVRAYFYTAVRNRAANVRRHDAAESARWNAVTTEDRAAGMGARADQPDVALARHETVARVAAALDSLPPRTHEAALLRWNDGLSRQEIAAVMGVALGTVKNHLTAATETLRTLLADLRECP